ncbi:hypothetical protein P0O24_09515 [Methanotrichaceae archaeon M04Ac]|uniref:Uncharacterized protein n=1 Tax=Candidatus Methanocrinis alkalitolerans TaxID=3033395 RepID=A0ABT5XGH1_9EURY|nr:hypothetical protein [Candidatus Methanocrinis alkalitolerans]MDF0593820.1 hypothetical protein [Candidatus Methanocrinis alkalitolerans]
MAIIEKCLEEAGESSLPPKTSSANRSPDPRPEGSPARSKPFAFLALMMLPLPSIALVQGGAGKALRTEDGWMEGDGPAAFEHIYSNLSSLNRYTQIF